MSPAQQIAVLIEEQADDEATIRVRPPKGEVQASAIQSADRPDRPDLPDWLDSQRDPKADTVAEVIARESLREWSRRWDVKASDREPWPPARPRSLVGQGRPGWDLLCEASTLAGAPCPICNGHVGPDAVCLGCLRTSGRLDTLLRALRDRAEETGRPDTAETKAEAEALLDRAADLAYRRYGNRARAARERPLTPPRTSRRLSSHIKVTVEKDGARRTVRRPLLGLYELDGWKVVA